MNRIRLVGIGLGIASAHTVRVLDGEDAPIDQVGKAFQTVQRVPPSRVLPAQKGYAVRPSRSDIALYHPVVGQ